MQKTTKEYTKYLEHKKKLHTTILEIHRNIETYRKLHSIITLNSDSIQSHPPYL